MIRTAGRLTIPTLGAVVLATAPAWAQTFHASTQKYKEKNPSAATGRSGGASLTARLLLAKDKTTLVEVTTGELDSPATPPGSLAKVQLKGFDSLGETMFTLNAGPLTGGGYWSGNYDTFGASQPFQIQGNVRGIDGKRTDVVTVTASVQKRPDLEAFQLQAADSTRVNVPVPISATIRELNHDVGARADCVLFVDDVEVSRLPGIWVDSGDAVSCAFSRAFTAAGSRQLKIGAVNVLPGDWDNANNSVQKAITVVDTSDFDYAYASAWHYKDYAYHQRGHGTYKSSTGGGYDWDHDYTYKYTNYEGFYYQAQKWTSPVNDVVSLTVSGTDGATSHSFTANNLTSCYAWGWDGSSGRSVYWEVWSCGGLYLWAQSYAGTVTYFNSGQQRYFDSAGTTTSIYVWNDSGNATYGTVILSGAQRTINATVTTSNGDVLSLPVTFSMTLYNADYVQPEYCSTYTYGTETWTSCYSWEQTGSVLSGWGSAVGGGSL